MTTKFVIYETLLVGLMSLISNISCKSYIIHAKITLQCNTTNPRKSLWTDDCHKASKNVIFFSTQRHSALKKYDNFFLDGGGVSYNLIIQNATVEDEGCYECKTNEISLLQETVKIEVPPKVQLMIHRSAELTNYEISEYNAGNMSYRSNSITPFATVLSTTLIPLSTTSVSSETFNGSTYSIKENEKVEIFCQANGSRPTVILSLMTNLQTELFNVSKQETTFHKQLYNSSNHYIMVVERKHQYVTCAITGLKSVGSVFTKVFLDVHYAPSCAINLKDSMIKCICIANPPVPKENYEILLNGESYANTSTTSSKGISGEARCVGRNVYGAAISDMILVKGFWTRIVHPKLWLLSTISFVILILTGSLLIRRCIKVKSNAEMGNEQITQATHSCECCLQLFRKHSNNDLVVDYKHDSSASTSNMFREGNTIGMLRYDIPSSNKPYFQDSYDIVDSISVDVNLDDMIAVRNVGSKNDINEDCCNLKDFKPDDQKEVFGSNGSLYEVASLGENQDDVNCNQSLVEKPYPVNSSEIYELDDIDTTDPDDRDDYDRVLFQK